jgi:internalin A
VPNEVLSQFRNENCLDSLRAHVRDLEAGTEVMLEVKLLVLGNGARWQDPNLPQITRRGL